MYPSLAIIFLPVLFTYLINAFIIYIEIFFPIYIGIFAVCLIPGWLWWSIFEPKWKVWAYGNIRTTDIAELKRQAILSGLIWQDSSPINKTEIWTNKDLIRMEEVSKRYQNGLVWR